MAGKKTKKGAKGAKAAPFSAPGGKNPMAGAVAAASKVTKVPYGKK